MTAYKMIPVICQEIGVTPDFFLAVGIVLFFVLGVLAFLVPYTVASFVIHVLKVRKRKKPD